MLQINSSQCIEDCMIIGSCCGLRNWIDLCYCCSQRYVADLGRAWPVLFVCGGLLPMLLCMLWLVAIRYFVGVVTWLTFVLLNVFMILLTLYFYFKGTRNYCYSSDTIYPVQISTTIVTCLCFDMDWEGFYLVSRNKMTSTIAKRLSILTGFLIFSAVGFLSSAGWLGNDAISAVIGNSGSDDLSVSFTVSGF